MKVFMTRAQRISHWPGRLLPTFLALVLALEVGLAFAGRPADSQSGITVEICSADGLRTLTLDPVTGKPVAPKAGHGHCPLCVLPAALFTAVPTALRSEGIVTIARPLAGPGTISSAAGFAVPAIRAPPATA